MLFTVTLCTGVTQPPGKDSKYFFCLCVLLLLSVCFIAVNNILLQLYLVTILIDLTFLWSAMCGHLWREMFVSKKNFYDLLFVFSSVFETPLFRLTNRRIASKLQTWWKKEDAGRGTLTNWYVFAFAQLSQKFWGRIWILIQLY